MQLMVLGATVLCTSFVQPTKDHLYLYRTFMRARAITHALQFVKEAKQEKGKKERTVRTVKIEKGPLIYLFIYLFFKPYHFSLLTVESAA